MSSTSPPTRYATGTQAIPARKSQDYPDGYSSTPGGTLYSTTPGGTKIVYDRSYLMNLRNSPISKTPPKWDNIPASIQKGNPAAVRTFNNNNKRDNSNKKKFTNSNSCDDGELFPIDI